MEHSNAYKGKHYKTEGQAQQEGKHYKRGLRCLKLVYEALMSQLVKERLIPHLADEMKENLKILRNASLSQESRANAHKALEGGC